jgi:hypothetical protein
VNKTLRRIFSCAAVLLLAAVAAAAGKPQVTGIDPPANILFVGNSYTYYNNSLHNMLNFLLQDAGDEVQGVRRAMTISGARLVDHGTALETMLAARRWDAVILQGQSTEPVDERRVQDFRRAARALDKAVDAAGAQTVFFMTWAPADDPGYMAPLAASYTAIGNDTGALVVPVGLAFAAVAKRYPEIALHASDGRHPSVAGTYLAACVFYAALWQRSPEGLRVPPGTSIDPAAAAALQRVAWEVTQNYYGR